MRREVEAPRPWVDHLQFLLGKIDVGADDLERVTVTQGNLRQWYDEIEQLRGHLTTILRVTAPGSRTLDDFIRDTRFANDIARLALNPRREVSSNLPDPT